MKNKMQIIPIILISLGQGLTRIKQGIQDLEKYTTKHNESYSLEMPNDVSYAPHSMSYFVNDLWSYIFRKATTMNLYSFLYNCDFTNRVNCYVGSFHHTSVLENIKRYGIDDTMGNLKLERIIEEIKRPFIETKDKFKRPIYKCENRSVRQITKELGCYTYILTPIIIFDLRPVEHNDDLKRSKSNRGYALEHINSYVSFCYTKLKKEFKNMIIIEDQDDIRNIDKHIHDKFNNNGFKSVTIDIVDLFNTK